MHPPSYRSLCESGELSERAALARDLLTPCSLCPRSCGADRTAGEFGFCGSGVLSSVSGAGAHFGEEPPITGVQGSGTIFFSGCNLRCIYCQNHEISRRRNGPPETAESLAGIMRKLEGRGCHNINLVSPTHVVPQILDALVIAAGNGLSVPLVYNTGGYDSVRTLRLLDGVVDIYMPDLKYGDNSIGGMLSGVPDYWTVATGAIGEMQRQVGDLVCVNGIAVRGLLIRHLVLPGGLAGSGCVLEFIAGKISRDAYVNVMDQYRWPGNQSFPVDIESAVKTHLLRGITPAEYNEAIASAEAAGLHRGFSRLR
jgi:putative pyruvate formate lyase activating enzyme